MTPAKFEAEDLAARFATSNRDLTVMKATAEDVAALIPTSIEDVAELMIDTGGRIPQWTREQIEATAEIYHREGKELPPDVMELLKKRKPTPEEAKKLAEEARDMIRFGGLPGTAGMLQLSNPEIEIAAITSIVEAEDQNIEAEKRVEISVSLGRYEPAPRVTKIPRIINAATKGIFHQTVTERRDQDGKVTSSAQDTQDIFDYYLESATIHINPLDPTEEKYSLLFRDAERKDLTIRYDEEAIRTILDDLPSRPGVKARRLLPDAVKTIIQKLRRLDRVTVERRASATGFFVDEDGMIYYSTSSHFDVKLPNYKVRETRKALQFLDTIISFYAIDGDTTKPENRDHYLTGLYFYMQAPLGTIRKLRGRENRLLLLGGESHVGKTILEKIGAGIWGIPYELGVIGAAKITAAQLAEHLDRTTLPIALDEVRNALSDPTIADVLKNSTTLMMIKERIHSNQGFRRQKFMAYASPVLSTNFVPQLYVGMMERLIPVTFTVSHKRKPITEKKTFDGEEVEITTSDPVKEFEAELSENLDLLPHIGSGIRQVLLSEWPRIRDGATQEDQIEAGRQILIELYRYVDLEQPSWLQKVQTRYEVEEPDPVEEVCKFLAEDLLRRLQQGRPRDAIPKEWNGRLDDIRNCNLTPPYLVRVSKDRFSLTIDVLREMADKKKIEIVGNLPGLLARIQAHPEQKFEQKEPTSDSGRKVVYLDVAVFRSYVETGDEDPGYPPNPD